VAFQEARKQSSPDDEYIDQGLSSVSTDFIPPSSRNLRTLLREHDTDCWKLVEAADQRATLETSKAVLPSGSHSENLETCGAHLSDLEGIELFVGPEADIPMEESLPQTPDDQMIHFTVGCDVCGKTPIVGLRYRCLECLDVCGYDVCSDCYQKGGSVIGRFNQKHLSTHQMERLTRDKTDDVVRLLNNIRRTHADLTMQQILDWIRMHSSFDGEESDKEDDEPPTPPPNEPTAG